MSDDFNPYHKWLGIPAKDQPADHYRLLGVARFESDRDVITGASDQRINFLHTLQSGEHGKRVDKLLNEIANALKPVFLPGENLEVKIVKAGESASQGVGYLDDGTMVVVEGGHDAINQTLPVTVTSVLQKSAGRMIFSKHDPSSNAE